ncbi:3-coathanger stack domain-containing protein [uncultured Fibrella sp.]|uniref:3-coathanger stack domain-containing protein n=1 Tax=uncultured Fibrella sp. TaxID=1284596 RepID=UPI0035CA98D7
MRTISIICALLLLVQWSTVAQTSPPRLDVLKRAQANRLLLRWRPSSPQTWLAANDAGYTIQRTTVLPVAGGSSPKSFTVKGIKPADYSAWEMYFERDSAAYAVLFIMTTDLKDTLNRPAPTPPAGGETALQGGRYTYAMASADLSFGAAVKAGLGFIDTDVKAGEQYRYTISTSATVLQGSARLSIPSVSVDLSLSGFTALPPPRLDTLAKFDRRVTLSWDETRFDNTYAGYHVQRATNGAGQYRQLTRRPLVRIDPVATDSTKYLYYRNELPNRTSTYQYRLVGVSYFGEQVASTPRSVTFLQSQENMPVIKSVKRTGNSQTIRWKYPEVGENNRLDTLLTGFWVSASNKDMTGFVALHPTKVNPTIAELTFSDNAFTGTGVDRTKTYFLRVSAVGIEKDTVHSLAYIIVQNDREPPATPTSVTAVDSLATSATEDKHVIKVSWHKNTEKDLLGYRVYRRIGNDTERQDVSGGIKKNTFILDTLSRKVDFPVIKYYVYAYDSLFHESLAYGYAEYIQPDKKAPMPPIMTQYKVGDNGVTIFFDRSPEANVVPIRHQLLRRGTVETENWQVVANFAAGDTSTRYIDNMVTGGRTYTYSMLAYDLANNQSCFRPDDTPKECFQFLKVIVPKTGQIASPTSFSAQFNMSSTTSSSEVALRWVTSADTAQGYEIYKGLLGAKPTSWKSVDGSTTAVSDASIEVDRYYIYTIRAIGKEGQLSTWVPIVVKCVSFTGTTPNQPPVLTQPLVGLKAIKGNLFTYTTAYNSFTDTDGMVVSILLAGRVPQGMSISENTVTGTPSSIGLYNVDVLVTDNDGATTKATLPIEVLDQVPVPQLVAISSTICSGESVALKAYGCPGTVYWSSGESGIQLVVSPQASMTVSAQCRTADQQSAYAKPLKVTVIPPLPTLVFANKTICMDQTVTLKPDSSVWTGKVRWSTGFVGPTHTVGPVSTTVYSATAIQGGCSGTPSQVTVTVSNLAKLTLTGFPTICGGQPASLSANATNAISYSWSTGSTSPTATFSTTGLYGIKAQNQDGCIRTDSVMIISAPNPTAKILGPPRMMAGKGTILKAAGGDIYYWSNGATSPEISVSAVGPYSVTVIDNNGCKATATHSMFLVGGCTTGPDPLVVSGTFANSTVNTFAARNELTTNTTGVLVQPGARLDVTAGTKLSLKTGFIIKSGAGFTAKVKPCQ